MVEDFGTEAISYNDEMIVLSTQLNYCGEQSAKDAIALTEYLLSHYNIDKSKVYLHGYSGGGETGSLVMGMRPALFSAYLITSSHWDGDMQVLADAKTPVYMATGESDSYYGSEPLISAYNEQYAIYEAQGLSKDKIEKILILDVNDQAYFTERGYTDQHMGGMAFAHEEAIVG